MKRSFMKWKTGMLMVLIITLMVPGLSGMAATQKQKALNAYKKVLSQKTVDVLGKGRENFRYYHTADGLSPKFEKYSPTKASDVQFAIAYIDNDSVPELILKYRKSNEQSPGIFAVFTYKNGKVVRVNAGGGCDQFAGYYSKTGTYRVDNYYETYTKDYHKLNNAKTSTILRYDSSSGYSKVVKGNEIHIDRASFAKLYSSATKGKSLTKVKFYKNTAGNRNKYLK